MNKNFVHSAEETCEQMDEHDLPYIYSLCIKNA